MQAAACINAGTWAFGKAAGSRGLTRQPSVIIYNSFLADGLGGIGLGKIEQRSERRYAKFFAVLDHAQFTGRAIAIPKWAMGKTSARGPLPKPVVVSLQGLTHAGRDVASAGIGMSRCNESDNLAFKDPHGDHCSDWSGYAPCDVTIVPDGDYTKAQLATIRLNCPFTCGGCTAAHGFRQVSLDAPVDALDDSRLDDAKAPIYPFRHQSRLGEEVTCMANLYDSFERCDAASNQTWHACTHDCIQDSHYCMPGPVDAIAQLILQAATRSTR